MELKKDSFPRNKPKLLKAGIDNNVVSKDKIQYAKFTRMNKLLIETEDQTCVQEMVNLDKILGVSVTLYIQIENITSKFVLHDNMILMHPYPCLTLVSRFNPPMMLKI